MLTPDLFDLVREPATGSPLVAGEALGRLRSPASGLAFRIEGGPSTCRPRWPIP